MQRGPASSGGGLAIVPLRGRPRRGTLSLVRLAQLALRQGDDALALAHAQSALDIAVAVHDAHTETIALCQLGNAELALGRPAAAATFERAHAVALEHQHVNRYDAGAGMARAALARGDVAGALLPVEEVLAYLTEGGTLDGTEAKELIWLTCYRVLAHAGDPRAAGVLATSHSELQARASAITDATLRHSFLNDIPEHSEIVAAWAAGRASPQGPV